MPNYNLRSSNIPGKRCLSIQPSFAFLTRLPCSRILRNKLGSLTVSGKPDRAVHKLLQFSQKVAQKLLQNSKSCSKVGIAHWISVGKSGSLDWYMPLLEQLTGCTMPYFYVHVGEVWPQCLDKIQWLLYVLMRTNGCYHRQTTRGIVVFVYKRYFTQNHA